MKTKSIFSFLLMLFAEALIIICFLYFGGNLKSDILALNIIVSTVILCLWFVDILFPLVDFNDKSHKTVGSLGIRWIISIVYTLAAITAMIVFNTSYHVDFITQVLAHALLIFTLVLWLFFSFAASAKVHEVYVAETIARSRINDLKTAMKEVRHLSDERKDIPREITARLTAFQESLRFLSPCDNSDATDLEATLLAEIKNIQNSLYDIPMNENNVLVNIEKCERVYKERKQIFSN